MQERDFDDFCAVLDGTCALLSRGSYKPNAASSALFFRALQRYPLAVVRQALEAHIADPARGKFVPVPADVIAQIEQAVAADGRPEDGEAWGIALRCADELATVVWTDEMRDAWAVARPVLEGGDEVGARMAFKAAYNRMVDAAREKMLPAVWTVSEGHDPEMRRLAVEDAVKQGRIHAHQVPDHLAIAAPADGSTLLLPGFAPVGGVLGLANAPGCPPEVAANLRRMRDEVLARSNLPGLDGREKQRTREAQAALADRLGQASLHAGQPQHDAGEQGVAA